VIVGPVLFSSWPTDIPNNIKRLKLSLSNYAGEDYDDGPYEDEYLQNLPPHLTSLTLGGNCFRISPSFFGSLPKSVTFLELLSIRFTHQLREKPGDKEDGCDDIVAGKDNEEEKKEGRKEEEEEEEEEFYHDDCLKDTVIVRHCPKHIELHMDCIFTGAFLPPNTTKLKTSTYGILLQSLTPGISKLTSEIEIIKAICPGITTLGTPPPKILLFSGQEISFPADCKALLSQLEVLEVEA
jgi:hypothetical protein